MATNNSRKFRGIAAPVFVREPLLLRLCTKFVDNLTLILRAGLVMGAVLLVHDLRILLDEVSQPIAESAPAPAVPVESEAIGTTEAQETALSEGVMHALNCTYEDYRNTHYDECVEDPSNIYLSPHADPDDTGLVFYDAPILYARLDGYARVE